MSSDRGSHSHHTPREKSEFCCNPLQCRCGRHRIPQRVILAILLHFLLQSNFNTRVVLNVAIVEMVEQPHMKDDMEPACPEYGTPNRTQKGGSFPWPSKTKSVVLFAFYIGYTFTQVPGGWFSDIFGARYVIIIALMVTVLSTALFPIMTQKFGYLAAVGLRFMLGAAHGPSMPAISSLVSTWIPHKERALLGGISYGGPNLGIIMGNIVSGILIHTYDGWPVAFYAWATYSGCYMLFYICYGYSFPDTHPFISEEEADYIMMVNAGSSSVSRRSLKTPWKAIFLNPPYWANIAAQFGHNYIYFTLITYLPSYMREILQFDVECDGYFAAAPFAALWLTTILLSATSNLFLRHMSQHTFDKIFGAGSNVASAILILGAVYSGCNRVLSITLYVLSMVVKAFYYVTVPVNINVLSRNYGGVLFGAANGISSLSGIIGNYVIGALTENKQLYGWKLAYWITLGVTLVTTVLYCTYSSAERQGFDYDERERLTLGN